MFLPEKIHHLQKIRCIIREPQYDKLDRACYMWFMKHCSKGALCLDQSYRRKLNSVPTLYPEIDAESFKASSGWFHKFCGSMVGEQYPLKESRCQQMLQQLIHSEASFPLRWNRRATLGFKSSMQIKLGHKIKGIENNF